MSGAGRGVGAARTTVATIALGLLAAACTPADDAPSTPSPSPTGSAEPAPIGTMAGTWYAEGADGAATVVVVQTATPDPQQAMSAQTMVGVAQDALRLAAG